MAAAGRAQPYREPGPNLTPRAIIAALLEDLDRCSPAGFAIALHIRFTTPTYLFQTYPRRWMDHYSATGLVVLDPTVRWGVSNVGRVRWSDLEPADEGGVLEQAKDFGIMNGVALATVAAASRSIASFARADREYHEPEIDALEETFLHLHHATLGPGVLDEHDRKALTDLSIQLTR